MAAALPTETSAVVYGGEYTDAPGEIVASESSFSGDHATTAIDPPSPPNATAPSPSPPLPNRAEQRAPRERRTALASPGRDPGYIPLNEENVFEDGVWKRRPVADAGLRDKFDDRETFVDDAIIIQIVTFHMGHATVADWAKPLVHWTDANLQPPWPTDNSTIDHISRRIKEKARGTWRWIHCEGYNGDALRAVAEATGWPISQFACLFGWTRASAELASGRLLIHLVDQGADIFALYAAEEVCPTFITCTGIQTNEELKRRLYDFVERGDIGRPELVLRTDPSLMLYGLVRAVGQDLRASALKAQGTVVEAYTGATSLPSHGNLTFFHDLQKRLYRIKVDTTGLVHALHTLKAILDKCQPPATTPVPDNSRATNDALPHPQSAQIVSSVTYERVVDQIGLVELLVDELQEICRQVDAAGALAFNTLAYNTNAFLKLLAVFTIVFLPISVITNVLAVINAETSPDQKRRLSIVFGSLGGISVLLLLIAWALGRHCHKTLVIRLPRRTKLSAAAYSADNTPLPQSWTPDQLKRFDEEQKRNKRRQESLSRPDYPSPTRSPSLDTISLSPYPFQTWSPRGSIMLPQGASSSSTGSANTNGPRHRKTHPPTLPPMHELDERTGAGQGIAPH